MLLNLVMLFMTTRWMGAENKGEISILVLNLSVAAILSGLFGGPSLVYLAPRFPLKKLLTINYLWSIFISILIAAVFYLSALPLTVSPKVFVLLASLECLTAANLMLLLGREQIKEHNWVQVIKISVTVGIILFQFLNGPVDFDSFVIAYAISLGLSFLISIVLLLSKNTTETIDENISKIIKACFKYGGTVQIGNVAQLLNYRLSYYVLELIISPPQLALIRIGIFHTAVQVAEALWQFARSISTVQYSHVSNLDSRAEGVDISIKLAKLNYLVTFLALVILLLIPASFFTEIFGPEFSEVKTHLWFLAPGIFMFSISNAFSHFFAGVGDHRYNTYTSIFGLILTALLIYPSIKHFGTIGAAVISSAIYCIQTIIQYAFFKRSDGVQLKSFFIRKEDLKSVQLLYSQFQRRK